MHLLRCSYGFPHDVPWRSCQWAAGHDETVEVNQRALIDKVLARYSGEFTVFRELLQNSDDAGARSVEIHFETEAYLNRQKPSDNHSDGPAEREELPNLKTAVVHQWTFKNNGIKFRDEDWNRLKKIAEGNPDEEKIGAFGVGFYSLFSVTEEPWVASGGRWMNFYWKGGKDQLYARRGALTASEDKTEDPWTTFQMTLREPGPIPAAFDFTRFLVSSITFMAHLSEVSVFFDDKRLVRLSKDGGVAKDVPMLRGLKSTSPERTMTVRSIQSAPLHIEAEVVRWVYTVGSEKPATISIPESARVVSHRTSKFFSSLFSGLGGASTPQRVATPVLPPPKEEIDLLEAHTSGVVLSIFSAHVDVRLDRKMTAELLRSTKKNPPSKLRYELIYTGKDEYDASVKEEQKAAYATGSVFQGLRADLEGAGSARVFIGHSTGQTTGIGGHMATRFIPTVERESIDLVDRNVAVWNKELLYVGGFLARSAYELELAAIKKMWDGASATQGPGGLPDDEIQAWLQGRALHALKFFTFHPSTPSSVVSDLMRDAFFVCAPGQFPIISSEGVMNANLVHIPGPEFSGFLKRLPVIPENIVNGAENMITTLRARGMIKDITFVDVLRELRSRPLTEEETVACLKWWVGVAKQGNNPSLPQGRSQLLDAIIVTITGPTERIMKLSDVQTYLNLRSGGAIIPTDGPLPGSLLPSNISRFFDPDVLTSTFPWKPLTVVDWLGYVTDSAVASANAEFDITLSASWAERVLSVLARGWPSMSKAAQEDVVRILKPKSCVPTSAGLKLPDQAYFSSVNLFRDLPIVTMPSGAMVKGALEKVLQSLGVRKHVELQIVFDRMIKTGDWTIFDLVKYLVSVQSTLAAQELERLKHTSAFPKEDTGEKQSPAANGRKIQRYKAMDLYEPVDIFRELGLPVIDWGTDNRWKPSSDEAKFLFSMGLRRAPPLADLLRIASSNNTTVQKKALDFFLDNYTSKYSDYDPVNFHDVAFVPALRGSEKVLARPLEVYSSPDWAALGFAVVDPQLREGSAIKLKLSGHPPTARLVTLLERSPPENEGVARQWFEVLSGRVPEFTPAELRKLSETPFVPTRSMGDKSVLRRLPPKQCYFSGVGGAELHSKFFVFVDFGARANAFLAACGTKQEPSVEEIAQILLTDPRQFYEHANGRESYLFELRNLAVNRRLLTQGTIIRMKRSNILLGSRRVKKSGGKASSEGDEEDWDYQDDLLQPNRVVIADDTNSYQLFGDRIFCAPQEDILEEFYLFLGSPRLSALVREDYRPTAEIPTSKAGAEVRHLVLERLPLFLHEHSQSRTKVSFGWLNEEKNFIVKVFGKLLVTKSLQHVDARYSEGQEASAVAKRDGKGPIELWLAGNTQVDMYEVATSLCRHLFESPKVNDALLFMTILSTDLKALKRRGYNVDRILRQQKAERDAAEKVVRETRTLALASDTQKTAQGTSTKAPPAIAPISASERAPSPPAANTGLEELLKRPTSAIQDIRRFGRNLLSRNGDASSPQARPTSPSNEGTLQPLGGPSRGHLRPPETGPAVTPLSSIANNVDKAIKACGPEGQNLIKNREQMQIVKESLDEGYCDVSGRSGDLQYVGSMGGVKVYAAQDIQNPQTLIERKHDMLARFLHVLLPLVTLYKLPQQSLHIFIDDQGPLIAFNRGGSLFMNLRFFEAWHDQDVQRGDFSKAYISWYFTFAHEIAHNIVHPHNSEHEFHFSAICEQHLVALGQLLARP
ncbi:hypothetical protein BC834DRAFT_981543 [Gloeopeniophorella convolvens]|nr:hypothetical protein BC834DRAFT_981543 [Gloeopeniophorella convolvens]